MLYASKIIKIAEAELGYLEKASNKDLDSKTANAGSKNYTKYSRDLHKAGFFNNNKQGYAWCAVFVTWLGWKLCGEDRAKAEKLLCQTGPYGAGCTSAAQYYKQQGRFYTSNPKPGDQIFFWDTDKTRVAHTGIVSAVDDTYVYTIEGNTSSEAGVVANGGCVRAKQYKLTYARIHGYGRPKYDAETSSATTSTKKEGFEVTMETLKKGNKGEQVKTLQALLRGLGYKDDARKQLTVDGSFGAKTGQALAAYQKAHKDSAGKQLKVDQECGPKTWGSLLAQ